MKNQDSINRNRNFPSTRWSLIELAQGDDPVLREQAKEDLVKSYLPVLRAYLVLKKRISPAQAEDFVQEFALKKLVSSNLIDQAAESKGRFRNFLLVCLNNTIRDHFRVKANQEMAAEEQVFEGLMPQQDEFDLFDGIFARNTFINSLERMKSECEEESNTVQWEIFCHRVLIPLATTDEPADYESLVRNTGLGSAKAVQNCLVNAKRRFKKCLLQQVQEYVGDEDLVDYEIHQLCRALTKTGNLDIPELNRLLPQKHLDQQVQLACKANSLAFQSIIQECESDDLAWSPQDLRPMWIELLHSPANEHMILNEESSTPTTGRDERTLEDCLVQDETPLSDLLAIKKKSRKLYRDTKIPVYFALYCATIAKALDQSMPEIADLDPKDLLASLESIAADAWLDARTQSMLNESLLRKRASR